MTKPIVYDLFRIPEQGTDCTRGALCKDGVMIAMTLERLWVDNKPNVSCIPFGSHEAIVKESNSYGRTLEVFVRGRSDILLHVGNWARNSKGCILLGKSFGLNMVQDSGRAIASFRETLAPLGTKVIFNVHGEGNRP